MNRRQKIIVSVTGIFLVLLILVGLTYAYFLTQIQGNEEERSISVTTAKLELVYSDNTPEVTLTGIIPITTDKVKTEGLVKKFTISKTNESSDVYTTIKLSNLNVSENIALYDMKWALYQGEIPISTGDFGGKTEGEIVLVTNQLINTTEGLEYSLHIWINETGIDQSSMMNGTVSGKLDISGLDKPLKTLSSLILGENNSNVITTAPTFSATSTDRGLYVQQGDITKSEMGFPTYYFKGSATNENEGYRPEYIMNNYVKFGTYAESGSYTYKGLNEETWEEEDIVVHTYVEGNPIIWRVVRINEDGSIKLITEDIVSSETIWNYNSNNVLDNLKYINTDGTDSTVKNLVETWYDTHIGSNSKLDNKVIKSSFCNNILELDDFISRSETDPLFVCLTESIIAYSKTGLLTLDELVSAGAYSLVNASNPTYLNNNFNFWTMTSLKYLISDFIYYMNNVKYDKIMPEDRTYIRAVINVSPDVLVTGGDGLTSETAYIIG